MTTYNIVGIEVEVPTSTENYVCFLNQLKGVLENLDSNFDKWYNSQGNCEKVYENQYDTIIEQI